LGYESIGHDAPHRVRCVKSRPAVSCGGRLSLKTDRGGLTFCGHRPILPAMLRLRVRSASSSFIEPCLPSPAERPPSGPMDSRDQARRLSAHGPARSRRHPFADPQRPRLGLSLPDDRRGGQRAAGAILPDRRRSSSRVMARPSPSRRDKSRPVAVQAGGPGRLGEWTARP
jgi:hypothetical protein